ncbi:MAG: cytochrome c [Saprospiraceae bacterium]|nr:cytochrome c [Saprospiraceae bacterium]
MKKLLMVMLLGVFVWACGGDASKSEGSYTRPAEKAEKMDDGKGIGVTNVKLNVPLNQEMVANGKAIYELKCAACHRLSAKRVVGPGWAGLTDKRKPEWIMNMITNVDVMLEKDPVAQKLLEECLTRMPNQNVTESDARDILEFIYQNDIDQKAKG